MNRDGRGEVVEFPRAVSAVRLRVVYEFCLKYEKFSYISYVEICFDNK